jgi:hypothetical protein
MAWTPIADAAHVCPVCDARAWEEAGDRVRCSACKWEPDGSVAFAYFREPSQGTVAAKRDAAIGAVVRAVAGGLARRGMRFAVRRLPLYAVAPSPHRPELRSIGGRSEADLGQGPLRLRVVREDEFGDLLEDLLEDQLDDDTRTGGSEGARRVAIAVAGRNAEDAILDAEQFTHPVLIAGRTVTFDGMRAGEAWALAAAVDGVHLGMSGRDPEPYPASLSRVRLRDVG